MSSSAFLLLDEEPINTIGINVLEPLLKTQGLDVTTGTNILDVPVGKIGRASCRERC